MKILTLFGLVKQIRHNLSIIPTYLPLSMNYNNYNNNDNDHNNNDNKLNNKIQILNNFKKMDRYIANYKGTDWCNYIENVDDYEYKKIKIPLTNDNDLFDIHLICWGKGAISNIHDHPKYGCHLLLLRGTLNESLYSINNGNFIRNNEYRYGDISYIDNTLYYHSIHNNSNTESYSLHIYSPPNYEPNYFKN